MAEIVSENTHGVAEHAANLLGAGELVVFPTDTLYGLGAASKNDAAVRRLFAVKGRSPSKALPLLVSDRIMAEWVAEVSPIGHRLMSTLWPGALTIVLPRNPDFYSQALGGGQTVAIREPAHGLVRDIIHRLGEPLTGTSANRSGSRAAVSAQEAAFQLGQMVALVIDGGKIGAGSESTIVDITMPEGPTITRMGAVSREEVQRAAGVPVRDEST